MNIRDWRFLQFILLGLFFLVLLRTAWISDDAEITLRTVLNLIHGYGPRFNIDERVQAYTHPLWFFLISGVTWVCGNIYFATFFLSLAFTLLTIYLLLFRVSVNFALGLLLGFALLLSKAFVDFSTSGLENPLANFLLLLIVGLTLRLEKSPTAPTLTAVFSLISLLYLCRPDLPVLVLPLIIWTIYQARHRPKSLFLALLLGAIPAFLWTFFSLYYYGFPFANTAYAKLGAGSSHYLLLMQGLRYLLDSLGRDPLTLTMILTGVVLGFSGTSRQRALAWGIVLYLLYVVRVGGDFMSGRFLVAPLMMAILILSQVNLESLRIFSLAGLIALLGAANFPATLWSDERYANSFINNIGVADERGFYFQRQGLLTFSRNAFRQPSWVLMDTRKVEFVYAQLGAIGLAGGPALHLSDTCGLADPLLARLPADKNPVLWRIGHFVRPVPAEYGVSLQQNRNLLSDPVLKKYYDGLRLITRGGLNDPARWREIVRFNLG